MLAQKLVIGYASRIISQIISMVAGIVVARIAGPTVLGTVAFGMSFVSVFQFVADFGIGSAHVKLVSEGRNLAKCNGTYWRLKTALVLGFAVVVMAIVMIQRQVDGSVLQSGEHFTVVLIWLTTVCIGQLSQIPISTFAGLTEQAKQDIPSLFSSILTQVFRIGSVLMALGAIGLSVSQLIGGMIALISYYALYRFYPRGGFDRELAREYVKLALPITIIVICNYQIEYLDKVLLQYYSDSEQVGVYVAGCSIGGFVRTIGLSVGMLFFPLFSSAVARNDYAFIDGALNKFLRFSYIFIMPAVVLAIIFSPEIIDILLGSRYAPSGPVMAIMLAGMFFFVVNIPYGNLVMGMNRFRRAALLHTVAVAVFLGIDLSLLNSAPKQTKALATAIAVAVSSLVLGYLFRLSIWKSTDRVTVWKYEKYVVLGTVFAVVGYTVTNILFPPGSFTVTLGHFLLYLTSLYGILLLLGWVTKKDFVSALQVLDLRKMNSYIRSELGGKSNE